MPDALETIDQVLEIRRKGESAWVDVSGYASGLKSVGFNTSRTEREISGGTENRAFQTLKKISRRFLFDIDINETTRPVLWNYTGQLEFRWGPFGKDPTTNERHNGEVGVTAFDISGDWNGVFELSGVGGNVTNYSEDTWAD